MAHQRAILLFDIDGTLIDCGGAGRTAMERAFDAIHRRPDAVETIAFGGMTDPAIMRQGLTVLGIEPSQPGIESLLEAYLTALAQALEETPRFRVLPDVEATLDRAARAGHAIGLGTGNVKRGADLKLTRASIWGRFAFGGFACDAEDRAELLRMGAQRGKAHASHERVVIIGDTPRDVAAALAIGAECLAVATGRFGMKELSAAGPTLTVRDLADPAALEFLA